VDGLDDIDFYLDARLVDDPYPYYESMRSRCPVQREGAHGTYVVTGFEEAITVLTDHETFSSCVSMPGPFAGFPSTPDDATDVRDEIERFRDAMPMGQHLISLDPPVHTAHRGLLMRLITPKRLSENEEFMWRLADRQLDEFIERGECEFLGEFATPFTVLVVTDLLGVPDDDRLTFRRRMDGNSSAGADTEHIMVDALAFLYDKFVEYVEDRRRVPRDDVLTGLATATFPDGTLPEPPDVAHIAAFLFAAGGDTTSRLLGASLKTLAEDQELQQALRDDRARIPNFIEEMLRFEGVVKTDHRLTRVPTTVGGVDIPAGRVVTVLLPAANRDPRHFENADQLNPDRPNARHHIAFGQGIHTCAGAPLARAEARVALERVLDRMANIQLSEEHHGPANDRRFEYLPGFVLRGLRDLYLEFTPTSGAAR
jgi:cytochrome P450